MVKRYGSSRQAAFMHFDFCIIGSGFAGSLLAWILARHGRSVALIDRGMHPRFAVGESSTPLADYLLERIALKFELPELRPLSRWGSWQACYPELRAGKKRGFSYYAHHPDREFVDLEAHASSLLVTASEDDQHSDTHWMRSDVDAWLCSQAVQSGALYLANFREASLAGQAGHWSIVGSVHEQSCELSCDFVIDASGGSSVLARALDIEALDHRLQTRTGRYLAISAVSLR